MTYKDDRERKELENLFADPKYARQAWKAVGQAILRNPASVPIADFDKDGNETLNSRLQRYTYQVLSDDLSKLSQEHRQPTELEMILACQVVKARTDTSAAIFVRDTLGAKPIDESKVDTTINAFESLTDEELELLAKHRAERTSQGA